MRMKALGMIEVYGYVAAVEALDSALKAANVGTVEVTKVQGGLVAVFVSGDVGAVRAAVAAGAAASAKVGRVISTHVIPRPAEDTGRLFEGNGGNAVPPDNGPTETPPDVQGSQAEEKAPPEEPEEDAEIAGETEIAEEAESAEEAENAEEAEIAEDGEIAGQGDALAVDAGNIAGLSEESMRGMTVAALRSTARALNIPGMTRHDIRFAKKEELIRVITAFLEQGR